uniref:31 kDa protein n=1 Tax=Peony yellowing associated secovirus satellite RNA TaxID=2800989 RepID=A0A7L7QUZ8_9VIRU|nr:31 kDa protein [Peony yellowing associated secovirus satellite RNA]
MVQSSDTRGVKTLPKRVRVISKSTGRIFTVGRHDLHILPSGKRAWVPVRGPATVGGSSRRERPPRVVTKQPEVRPIRAPIVVKNKFSPLSVEKIPKSKQTYADAVRAKVSPVKVRKGVVTLIETDRDFRLFEGKRPQPVPIPGQAPEEARSLSREFAERALRFSGRRFKVVGLPEGPEPLASPQPRGPVPAKRVIRVEPFTWDNMSYGQTQRVLSLYKQLASCFRAQRFELTLYKAAVRKVCKLMDSVPISTPRFLESYLPTNYDEEEAPPLIYV